jgi:putative intracellular protease/amidase
VTVAFSADIARNAQKDAEVCHNSENDLVYTKLTLACCSSGQLGGTIFNTNGQPRRLDPGVSGGLKRILMIRAKRNGAARDAALILLAQDFREGTTVFCLERLRQAGISVSLVGLSARLIRGYHGMAVKPDFSIEQLPGAVNYRLVIIPEGKACVSALLADPRVHQLIETTLHNRGLVAVMPDAEVMLEQSGLVTSSTASSFIWQRGSQMEEFTAQLINTLE